MVQGDNLALRVRRAMVHAFDTNPDEIIDAFVAAEAIRELLSSVDPRHLEAKRFVQGIIEAAKAGS